MIQRIDVPLRFHVSGKTDVGLVRAGNEDYLHIDEANAVFAVCDGMGGHQAGEVASMTASQTIRIIYNNLFKEIREDSILNIDRTLPLKGDVLVKAIRLANREIYNQAASDSSQAGMGTTVVALALEDDIMSVAHVGDSRAYQISERELLPLTRDHSWLAEIQQNHTLSQEEASLMVGKNVITRALGVRENVEVDYRAIKVKQNDKFLLCSDGLCGFVDDDEIFEVAYKYRNDNDQLVNNLIQMANDRGGADNVTIIVLEVIEVKPSAYMEIEVFTQPAESAEILEAEDQWLEKINKIEVEEPKNINGKKKNSGKLILYLLFFAFIVLAGFIIYFAGSK